MFSTALAKDPADRFDQCHDFAATLSERAGFDDRLLIGRSGSARSAAAADTQIGITTPVDTRPRRRSLVAETEATRLL